MCVPVASLTEIMIKESKNSLNHPNNEKKESLERKGGWKEKFCGENMVSDIYLSHYNLLYDI